MARKPTFRQVKLPVPTGRPPEDTPGLFDDPEKLLEGAGSLAVDLGQRGLNYVRTRTPSQVGDDISRVASTAYGAAKRGVQSAIADPSTAVGNVAQFAADTALAVPTSLASMGDLRGQAATLRDQGDATGARRLEGLAAATVLGAIPAFGKAAKGAEEGLETATKLAARYGAETQPIVRNLTPQGMYSHAADAIRGLPQEKFSPTELKALLTGPKHGVNKNEFRWSGYDRAFDGRKSVTKDEAQRFFENSKVPLWEKTYLKDDEGSAVSRWGANEDLVVPHHSDIDPNYRELAIGVPSFDEYHNDPKYWPHIAEDPELKDIRAKIDEVSKVLYETDIGHNSPEEKALNSQLKDLYAMEDMALERLNAESSNYDQEFITGDPFTGSHYDPNTIAHLRLSDRMDEPTGQKMTFIEENQSDLGQQGRQGGFRNESNGYLSSLPYEMPHTSTTDDWTRLTMKRALYEAAKNESDRLAWTPGHVQNDRYGLSDHFVKLEAAPAYRSTLEDPLLSLTGFRYSGGDDTPAYSKRTYDVHPDKLEKLLGKDVAEQLRAQLQGNYADEIGGYTVGPRYDNLSNIGPTHSTREEAQNAIDALPEMIRSQLRIREVPLRAPAVVKGKISVTQNSLSPQYDQKNPKILADILRREYGVTADFQPATLKQPESSYSGDAILEHYNISDPQNYWRNLEPADREALVAKYKAEKSKLEVPSIVLTPELRQRILNEGFRNFAQGGLVSKYNLKH